MANATFQLSESATSVNLTLPDTSGTLLVDANILARVVASSPQWYKRQTLPTVTKDTVTIPAGLQINIDDQGFVSTKDVTLNTSSLGAKSGLAGKDVYIYAVTNSGALGFVLSLNSTVPDGYNAQNSRKIGGFHCLCVAVGTIADHPLSGYVAGDILPASLWDLLHRPKCKSHGGMVYDSGLDLWIQIYLPSWDGSKLVSRYQGVIVDGSSSHACHGESFAYEAGDMGGRLIRRDEFIHCMRGVPECVNIQGSNDPNTTGGHVATNGQRIISNIGVEDGVGVLWQWGADTYECFNGNGVSWSTDNFYLSGYSLEEKSVFNPSYDSVNRGSCDGLIRRARLGARWANGADCGSRALSCSYFSSNGWAADSARIVSEPRVVNL